MVRIVTSVVESQVITPKRLAVAFVVTALAAYLFAVTLGGVDVTAIANGNEGQIVTGRNAPSAIVTTSENSAGSSKKASLPARAANAAASSRGSNLKFAPVLEKGGENGIKNPSLIIMESTVYGTLLELTSLVMKKTAAPVTLHCPNEYWHSATVEEQRPIAPLFTLSPPYKSTRSKIFKPKKRVAVIFIGQFDEPSTSKTRRRAKQWSAHFDKVFLVGGDNEQSYLMSCNHNSYPHLIACAAHIMVAEGATFESLTILDATVKNYDASVCALVQSVISRNANAEHAIDSPLTGRIVVDTEPVDELKLADHCLRNRFVSHLFGYLSASDAATYMPRIQLPDDLVAAKRQLHWYAYKHRLKSIVIPSAAFHCFFKMASEWLMTDTPTEIGIVPFVEFMAAALKGGDGKNTPRVTLHRLRDEVVLGEASSDPTVLAALGSQRHFKPASSEVYGEPIFVSDSPSIKCPTASGDSAQRKEIIASLEPGSTNKHFAAFTKLPLGAWVVPYQLTTGVNVGSDAAAHADVGEHEGPAEHEGASADEAATRITVVKRVASRFSVRTQVKGVGPVSPASPQVARTREYLDHEHPEEWSQPNFYPPTLVVSMKFNEILNRDFVRKYFDSLFGHFRRVVIISKEPAVGWNERYAPFPRYCLDGLSTIACMMHLLRKRLVRRSGGIMFIHIDAFIFPLEHFGDGRTRDMLISKRHQYFGGHPDEWPLWPDPYKTDYAGTSGERIFSHWNRGLQTFGSFFHEWKDNNKMLQQAHEMRHNTFADIFFVPSRIFDLALDILDYHFLFMTPFEGFIGYWASVIASASTTRYNGFEYQGCCCCGSDGEVMTHPAGHKVTPSNQQTVLNMAKRIDDSFSCETSVDLIAVTYSSLGPVRHIVKQSAARLFGAVEDASATIFASLEEQTCNVDASLKIQKPSKAVNALLVAPLTNSVRLKISCMDASSIINVYLHTPNVNTVDVSMAESCGRDARLRVAIATGVTMPTAIEGEGKPMTLDEGDDLLLISPTDDGHLTSVKVKIDTAHHGKSSVTISLKSGGKVSKL